MDGVMVFGPVPRYVSLKVSSTISGHILVYVLAFQTKSECVVRSPFVRSTTRVFYYGVANHETVRVVLLDFLYSRKFRRNLSS